MRSNASTSRRLVRTGLALSAVLGASVAWTPPSRSQSLPFEVTEPESSRPRCTHYDPQRQPFFGVTHLHTGLSFDASIRFVDFAAGNDPDGAYRFARGLDAITLPNVVGIQGVEVPGFDLPPDLRTPRIDEPIDWGGVTDHSEHFGEMGICKNFLGQPDFPDPTGRFSLDCRMINGFFWQPGGGDVGTPLAAPINDLQRQLASNAFTQLTMMNLGPVSRMTRMPVCVNDPEECDAAELAVWDEHRAAAADNYDRTDNCSFTTFVAYEVSSTPLGTNWHRNVFFRNDRVVRRPITAIDMGVERNDSPVTGGPDGVGEPPSFIGSIVPPEPDVFPVPPGRFSSQPLPERLWNGLERDCTLGGNVTPGLATHCEFLTIPHNSNLGGGVGCRSPTSYTDEDCLVPPEWFTPFNTEDARRRAEFEPLVEIYQNKGSSECRWDPRFQQGVDTKDEFCNFELLDTLTLSAASGVGTSGGSGEALPPSSFNQRAFVRNVWKDGLGLADQFEGINPFKMGVVASSDSHNGTMGWHPENETFPGHLGIDDAIPVQRASTIQNGSGGHSVVWAEENSRDSIFAALKRKETYGTSGTRIVLRFFGGWSFGQQLCEKDFVRIGYNRGVPMGGDLCQEGGDCQARQPVPDRSPTFLVAAWMDELVQTPLQQVQIIKGWVDAEGKTREKVVRVVGEPGLPNEPQKGVNNNTCRRNTEGSPMLCGVWQDPDFDPEERAFYYARVLEEPVCRYSTLWCQKVFGLNPLKPKQCNQQLEDLRSSADPRDGLLAEYGASCCSNQTTEPIVQPAIQERAWSSPIWYTPAS